MRKCEREKQNDEIELNKMERENNKWQRKRVEKIKINEIGAINLIRRKLQQTQ